MFSVRDELEAAFGTAELPSALFYQFPISLRFELGGEGVSTKRPIKRFIQAFERATTVASDLFECGTGWMVIANCSYARRQPKDFKRYTRIGLQSRDFIDLGTLAHEDEDRIKSFGSDLYTHWAACPLSSHDSLQEVLWLKLGAELGISPSVYDRIYFVDFDRQIILHPYDDRGMDVVANQKETLLGLFRKRRSWLLDHDMARMTETFEGK